MKNCTIAPKTFVNWLIFIFAMDINRALFRLERHLPSATSSIRECKWCSYDNFSFQALSDFLTSDLMIYVTVRQIRWLTYRQGIWSGTPWIVAIQDFGLFWIGVWSFHSNLECNPECNPKLRHILDLECVLHSKSFGVPNALLIGFCDY